MSLTTWNLSKVIWALGRLSAVPAMTAGLMSMHTSSTASGFPPWAAKSLAKTPTVPASLPSATNEIDEQADIVVATPGCRLVKGDAGDVGVIGAIPSRLDVVVDDPPQPGVPLIDHPRDNGHRHRLHHGHDQRLEQQRKTAVRPRPGDQYPLDPAALAGDPPHPRMPVGFVLKEVQVPPGLVLAVVGRTAGNTAFRAGEPAALREIPVDVQPLGRGVEFALRHHRRRLDTQRHPKQLGSRIAARSSGAAWPRAIMA